MGTRLEDLDLTREEVDKIGEALKQEEFRKLFVEYAEELNDPENKKKYEEEIIQLEKERGVDCTFVHPKPGYVIKTCIDGEKKTFINICYNDLVGKPLSTIGEKDGNKGLQWSIPYHLTPAREDLDNKKQRCEVYDVVFHSDTLHLASKNTRFRDLVNDTACDGIEQKYNVQLDRKNMKYPKLDFKGISTASVIRKDIPGAEKPSEEDEEFYQKIYPRHNTQEESIKPKPKPENLLKPDQSPYTTPKYKIKYRRGVDFQEFTDHINAKLLATVPTELIIDINLPLLKTTAECNLDVTEKRLSLISEKPSRYKLELTLPYPVNADAGNAKFDQQLHKLTITLPVDPRSYMDVSTCSSKTPDLVNPIDSGVDSDERSNESQESNHEEDKIQTTTTNPRPLVQEIDEVIDPDNSEKQSLCDDTDYLIPPFCCKLLNKLLMFTLGVKNVEPESVRFEYGSQILQVKFTSVGAGYFPQMYAFCLKINADLSDISAEAWDNNVTLQFLINSDIPTSYEVGMSASQLELQTMPVEESIKIISDDESESDGASKTNDTPSKSKNEDENPVEKLTEKSKTVTPKININNLNTRSKNKSRSVSVSESSSDELLASPSKCRGILKRNGHMSRSLSESSVDEHNGGSMDASLLSSYDTGRGYSLDTCEEEDENTKKTVRFSDNVSKKTFRSNSSILGRKKKNQKKLRNKKRALDRKLSESENSEEDKDKHDDKENTRNDFDNDNADNYDDSDQEEEMHNDDPIESSYPNQSKTQKDGPTHIQFKSELIFDLDM